MSGQVSGQVSEQEKEAIEILRFSPIFRGRKPENDCLEIVLNLIGKQQKVIDLMATELSRRPLMIYLDDERDDRLAILDNPKKIIKYYTKKAEE